jgi:hypothetical protein
LIEFYSLYSDKAIGGLRLITADSQERRIKMKGMAFFISTILMALALIVALPNTGQSGENEQLAKFYMEYISECICKNESKAALLKTSRSANLKEDGSIYKQKAVFLTNNQNVLVDEMIRREIGKEPYKVDYYLNKKFNGIIK